MKTQYVVVAIEHCTEPRAVIQRRMCGYFVDCVYDPGRMDVVGRMVVLY